MASVALRRAVTSIVSPKTTTTANVVTVTAASSNARELVPHKFDLATAADLDTPAKVALALERSQRNTADSTQSARSLPVLGGVYWPDITFALGVKQTFAHGIQGQVAFLACEPRPTFATWVKSTAYAKGAIVQPATFNGYWFVCSTAGTSNTTEPAWVTIVGATTGDGTAVWTCCGPIAPVIYETAQDASNGRITLAASNPCTVDLWLFPKAEAGR